MIAVKRPPTKNELLTEFSRWETTSSGRRPLPDEKPEDKRARELWEAYQRGRKSAFTQMRDALKGWGDEQ